MMHREEQSERDRIEAVYDRYQQSGYDNRWRADTPGTRELLSERLSLLEAKIIALGPPGQERRRVLDLGCGTEGLLSFLQDLGFERNLVYGADLLVQRLLTARERDPSLPLILGDAASLPLRASQFGLIVLQTLLSSVRDDHVFAIIAREIDRLLSGGGAVIVYDLRVPNPSNASVRAVSLRRLREAFPNYTADSETLTVAPPLARSLGRMSSALYPKLARISVVRTHRLTVLTKPIDR